jgi:EcsC protein family
MSTDIDAPLDKSVRELPTFLWQRMRNDPLRAPEHLALAAAELHGPAAAKWAAEQRRKYPYSGHDLARVAKRKHASLARYTGAATGIGGWITAIPDLASLAWIQSRLVFFIAAAYGYDPRDEMRPAELLVIQQVYASPGEAKAALDGAGQLYAAAYVDKKLRGQDAPLMKSLALFVGKRVAERGARRIIPFVSSPINAIANEVDTRRHADRAIAFYGGLPAP